MKAYAIWWLWAKLGRWEVTITESYATLPVILLTVFAAAVAIISRRRR